jgi:hypothetical protein
MTDSPPHATPQPLKLTLAGTPHDIALRMPAIGKVFGLLLAGPLRTEERMRVLGPAEIKRFVGKVDGHGCDIEFARALHAEPASFARYAITRTGWLESLCEAGMVFAQCPHCRS